MPGDIVQEWSTNQCAISPIYMYIYICMYPSLLYQSYPSVVSHTAETKQKREREMAVVQKLNTMIIASMIGLMITWPIMVAKSEPNTSVILTACNENSYAQSDAYANSVAYVLADMMNVTPNHGYDYKTQSPYAAAVSYGHATCNTALNYNDCADCMPSATTVPTELGLRW